MIACVTRRSRREGEGEREREWERERERERSERIFSIQVNKHNCLSLEQIARQKEDDEDAQGAID